MDEKGPRSAIEGQRQLVVTRLERGGNGGRRHHPVETRPRHDQTLDRTRFTAGSQPDPTGRSGPCSTMVSVTPEAPRLGRNRARVPPPALIASAPGPPPSGADVVLGHGPCVGGGRVPAHRDRVPDRVGRPVRGGRPQASARKADIGGKLAAGATSSVSTGTEGFKVSIPTKANAGDDRPRACWRSSRAG